MTVTEGVDYTARLPRANTHTYTHTAYCRLSIRLHEVYRSSSCPAPIPTSLRVDTAAICLFQYSVPGTSGTLVRDGVVSDCPGPKDAKPTDTKLGTKINVTACCMRTHIPNLDLNLCRSFSGYLRYLQSHAHDSQTDDTSPGWWWKTAVAECNFKRSACCMGWHNLPTFYNRVPAQTRCSIYREFHLSISLMSRAYIHTYMAPLLHACFSDGSTYNDTMTAIPTGRCVLFSYYAAERASVCSLERW